MGCRTDGLWYTPEFAQISILYYEIFVGLNYIYMTQSVGVHFSISQIPTTKQPMLSLWLSYTLFYFTEKKFETTHYWIQNVSDVKCIVDIVWNI
jgi:hypothetical protein